MTQLATSHCGLPESLRAPTRQTIPVGKASNRPELLEKPADSASGLSHPQMGIGDHDKTKAERGKEHHEWMRQ